MSSLAMVILSLLTFGNGSLAPHVRRQALPVQQWAEMRAEWVERASATSGVSSAIIVALAFHESAFKDHAHSPSGAEGLLQLLPGTPHFRSWMAVCSKEPYYCSAANLEAGAVALAKYRDRCGTMLRGLTAYRAGLDEHGRCKPVGPRARSTMALANRISHRLRVPSSRPMFAARLP